MIAIVVAIIGGLSAVAAAFVAQRERHRARESEKKVAEMEEATQTIAQTFQEELLKRFGFIADSVRDEREIVNLAGDVRVCRDYHGTRILVEDVHLGHIPGQFWTTPGKVATNPTLTQLGHFSKRVSLAIQGQDSHRCDFRIDITGGLTRKDGSFDYRLETTYSGGVVMTKEAAEEAYARDAFKTEYMSFDVDYPIRRLELIVTFPDDYPVRCFPIVFLAHSECEHERELGRIHSEHAFYEMPHGARLSIEGPLLGFRYAIYWDLPGQEVVIRVR